MSGTVRLSRFLCFFYSSPSVSLTVAVVRDRNCENCIGRYLIRVRIDEPVEAGESRGSSPENFVDRGDSRVYASRA